MQLEVIDPPDEYRNGHYGYILKDPIFRRQSLETDKEYKLFLIYRDIPWEERSLKKASLIACQNPNLKHTHPAIAEANKRWQWQKRVDAWELYIQEQFSDRQERIVLELKDTVEFVCLKIVRKIAKLEALQKAEDLMDPEIQRDLSVLNALIGKNNAGKFMLEAYRTIIGEKLELGAKNKVEPFVWKKLG